MKPVKNSKSQQRLRFGQADFMNRLTEKLSSFDAQLILQAAMRAAGVEETETNYFKKDETKTICLELIKRGGPAYGVGAGIYRELVS